MSRTCQQLDAFADGELAAAEAEAFRGHLTRCDRCPAELRELLALQARVRSLPPQHLVLPAGSARPSVRWRWLLALPSAALLAVALWWTRPATEEAPLQLAGVTRAVEGRLTHPLLAPHRPYDTARSEAAEATALPLGALARLEARGDRHAVAAAYLDRGELGQAEAFLRGLPDSPDVRSDRAVLALARGQSAAALRLAESALTLVPQHPPARWNRALALGGLGLGRLGAQQLRELEALAEPGWAQEARLRANALEQALQQEQKGWEQVRAAGEAMVAGGEILDEAAAQASSGLARLYLYDAVRTASTPARLEALRPLAAALDRRAGRDDLQRLLARTSPSPALSADYLRLVRKQSPVPEPGPLLIAATRAGRTDVALGVMLLSGLATTQPDQYRTLARGTQDPWFELLGEQTVARAHAAAGELARAEQVLGALLERCPVRGLEYRCALAAIQLAQLRVSQHRLDDAFPLLERGEEFARAAGDWGSGLQLLALRAEVARLGGALAVAAATLQEHRLRASDGCARQRYLNLALATVYFQQGAPDLARAELAALPECGEPLPVQGALLLADLQRFGRRPLEAERARRALQDLLEKATVREAPLLETVLGRLEVSTGNPRGVERLRKVIADTVSMSGGEAGRARAYAFSTLTVEAAAAGRFNEVFALLAQELKVPPPHGCAAAVAVDDERRVWAVRDAAGASHGQLQRLASPSDTAGTALPPALLQRLGGCSQVAVLARPPVQGEARLLPASVAWSYLTDGSNARPSGPARRVIVTGVRPPPSLGLRPLGPFRGDAAGAEQLSGAAATPEAVLAAARTASELQLHAHGRVGGTVSGAAHLVLSPDAEGRFALSAEAIRGTRLSGAPTVVLAACDSGNVAAYLHQAWGLPQAFREAGARAVFAARGALPDASSAAFFDGVLARVRQGEPPARALRDERSAWLDRGELWVLDVVLFE